MDLEKNIDQNININMDSLSINIGIKIIEWLKDLNLLDLEVITLSYKNKQTIIKPGKLFENILEKEIYKSNLNKYLIPNKIPMVSKPKPYKFNPENPSLHKLGGYLLNDIKYQEPLITPH